MNDPSARPRGSWPYSTDASTALLTFGRNNLHAPHALVNGQPEFGGCLAGVTLGA